MKKPSLHETVYIARGAQITGDVLIGKNSSVWYNAVLRGDSNGIRIGAGTNIQDGCILHEDAENSLQIGNNVTVGHGAILHGCCIEDDCLIGMGCILLNGVHVGKNCIIGAGSLVTQGTCIPDYHLAFGSPARVIRPLKEDEIASIRKNSEEYIRLAADARSAE